MGAALILEVRGTFILFHSPFDEAYHEQFVKLRLNIRMLYYPHRTRI